jgi:glycosyltransferase involved in cell wall biosynthesis
MTSSRGKVVVLGMMTKMPVAGVVWQVMHYLEGFRRLGYDPYYVEAHARTPSMFMKNETDDASADAAAFIDRVLRRFDLQNHWAFQALHSDSRCYGLSEAELRRLYRSSAILINLHGGTQPLPEHVATGRLVYVETDPVQLQIELHSSLEDTIGFLEPHVAFFTFAENLGHPDCGLPVSDRFSFLPTRQPVVTRFWRRDQDIEGTRYTTVGNWRQQWRKVKLDGEVYHWSKDREFRKFLDLPSESGAEFELALSNCPDGDRRTLEQKGWLVRDALSLSADPDVYRRYIQRSRGEFTVAKDQNVRLRSGWFSDRSATYLAAGRPVITQDTGFANILPTGSGLFAFSTPDEAAGAVEEIEADYSSHRAGAFAVAKDCFDSDVVLSQLLSAVGLPGGRRRTSAGTNRPRVEPEGRDRVSVVVPCFDLGRHLPETVESVRRQTRPAYEIIIVDDGSSDPWTLHVLETYRQQGVTVVRTPHQGASAARNVGVAHATGEYVLCLDADDVLMPEFLMETAARLDAQPDTGIVASHVEFFGTFEGLWRPPEDAPVKLLWQNCIPSASLFRRICWEEAGGYADLPACQDWEFWLSIVERGWRWSVVPAPLYRYRQRSGSISEFRQRNRPELLQAIVRRHPDAYEAHWLDVFLEMDQELQSLRKRIRKLEGTSSGDNGTEDPEHASRTTSDRTLLSAVEAAVRRSAIVGVLSGTEEELPELGTRDVRPFAHGGGGDDVIALEDIPGPRAVALLEEFRQAGLQFLLITREGLDRLDRCPDLGEYLRGTYRIAGRAEGRFLLFDLERPMDHHTFSVVICTYNRAAMVERAIESVFEQDYPKDRYELIVVDNGSRDHTGAVIHRMARSAPVPVSTLMEPRNGLSLARNRGIEAGRREYVAFLDDDAVASPDWLTALNRAFNETQALVLGGRVDKTFQGGFPPPAWFDPPYVRHFFGVNYRERGREESILRIRPPLYLTGANIAYARRLFDRFGGFDPRLGRDAGTLRAGEETHFNLILDQYDIPIYYTAEAAVDHIIESYRVTKRHIRRKAAWSGVSDALAVAMAFGQDEVRARARHHWTEIRGLAWAWMGAIGDPENFSRTCRVIHNLAFLGEALVLRLKSPGARLPKPLAEHPWTALDWIDEVSRWPEGLDKHLRLSDLYRSTGDIRRAAEAVVKAAEYSPARSTDHSLHTVTGPVEMPRRERYRSLVGRIRATASEAIPAGATVVVVSRGDEALLDLPGLTGWHFPQDGGGVYAGFHPADSGEAIIHLEELRLRGAGYLLLPSTSFWWLDHYEQFRVHVEGRYRRVAAGSDCLIFDLTVSPANVRTIGPEISVSRGLVEVSGS